jgi:7,8-dihydropterin-6-yl-methyl-4-(beta-D-ribofuranosyl)aminobenzene 5'-phosphate synthase
VLSHRHGDHTSGLRYLLRVNPHVKIYAPKEAFGASGISIISTVSRTPGTLELRELSLALETPDGLVLVVGCSHPGNETACGVWKTDGPKS